MNYAFILSPITNKLYNINSSTGKYVLQKYINQLGGHTGPCAINSKSGRCAKASKGDKNCLLQNGRCVKKTPKKAAPKKAAPKKVAPKKAAPKKAKSKTYYTNNNGGQPFKVVIDGKQVYVYKFKKYNKDTDTFLYSEKPIQNYTVKKVFIGKSNLSSDMYYPGSGYDGNSILLQITKNKYVFIGDKIFSFTSKSEIKKYKSPIGNSMVSYPFAIDVDGRYYFLTTSPGPAIIDKIPQSSLKKDYHNDPFNFYFQNKHLSSKLTIK